MPSRMPWPRGRTSPPDARFALVPAPFPRAGVMPHRQLSVRHITPGVEARWAATSEARIGAPPGPAARRAASPCRYAPTDPASRAVSPAASNDPVTPDSTSPLPAVASQLVPVGLTRTGPSTSADQRRRALEQHRGAVPRRQLPYGRQPCRLDVFTAAPQQCGGLPRMRRQQRRGRALRGPDAASGTAARPRPPAPAPPTPARPPARPTSSPMPGPITQACTRPALSGGPACTSVSGKRASTASAAGPT